jgi:hypothetical protein
VPYLKNFWSRYSKQKLLNYTTYTGIVTGHDKKFVKSYEFDLIFITEYFFLIQLLKMHFTIILIIIFLVT